MTKQLFFPWIISCGLMLCSADSNTMPLQPPSPLMNYPLSQMKMVGIINNGEQIWGIVRTPDNHVYSVTVDNLIGNEHSRVLQITSQRITIENFLPTGQMNIETLWLIS